MAPSAAGSGLRVRFATCFGSNTVSSVEPARESACCVRKAVCSQAAQGCGGGMRRGWGRSSTGCGHLAPSTDEAHATQKQTDIDQPSDILLHCMRAVACTEAPAAAKEHSTGQEERAGHPQSVSASRRHHRHTHTHRHGSPAPLSSPSPSAVASLQKLCRGREQGRREKR